MPNNLPAEPTSRVRQPSKEEAERAFDIAGHFQFCNEEKDRVELRGSPTMLALEISKALRDAKLEALEKAAQVVDGVPENLERHWQLSNLDMLLLKAIALKIRALREEA